VTKLYSQEEYPSRQLTFYCKWA